MSRVIRDDFLDPPPKKLSPRQEAFVHEYLIDNNGTQAAIRAGYASRSATSTASDLLLNTDITEAIEKGRAQRNARINMTADHVLQEIALLSHACVDHYYVDDQGSLRAVEGAPDGAMRAVQSVKRKTHRDKEGGVTYEVEFRLWNKPDALKLMGKHTGVAACSDRMEVSGPGGGPIAVQEVRSIVVDPKNADAE